MRVDSLHFSFHFRMVFVKSCLFHYFVAIQKHMSHEIIRKYFKNA